jgi:hypothetical protein
VVVADFNGDGIPDLAVPGDGGTHVLLGNGNGSFQTTNFSYGIGGSSVAVGDFNGDGLPDLAATGFVYPEGVVNILLNDGIWNGPAPRPGNGPRLTFSALPSALPFQQLSEAWWNAAPDAVALPTNPMPHQPLLDWLRPPPSGAEPLALPNAAPWSQEAWDAFIVAGVFDLGDWDLAPLHVAPGQLF